MLKKEISILKENLLKKELNERCIREGYQAIMEIPCEERTELMQDYLRDLDACYSTVIDLISLCSYLKLETVQFTVGINNLIGLPYCISKDYDEYVFMKDVVQMLKDDGFDCECNLSYFNRKRLTFSNIEGLKNRMDYYKFVEVKINNIPSNYDIFRSCYLFDKYEDFVEDIHNTLKDEIKECIANNKKMSFKSFIRATNVIYDDMFGLDGIQFFSIKQYRYNIFSYLMYQQYLLEQNIQLTFNPIRKVSFSFNNTNENKNLNKFEKIFKRYNLKKYNTLTYEVKVNIV